VRDPRVLSVTSLASSRGAPEDLEIAGRRRRRRNGACHPLHDLVARPAILLLPVGEHQDVVANGEHRRPMRDQHDNRSAGLEVGDGLAQSKLAIVVEIGVRLEPPIPIAMMVSPPRRCASTMIWRLPASCATARGGARGARSGRRVMVN
jgi:hypothetical protein